MRYTALLMMVTLALDCAPLDPAGATGPTAQPNSFPETIQSPPESTPEADPTQTEPLPPIVLPVMTWPEHESPIPLEKPNTYRVLALTTDSQRLIFTSDEAVFQHGGGGLNGNQSAPLIGTLHVMDLSTRAVTTIDTRLAIGIEGGLGHTWS